MAYRYGVYPTYGVVRAIEKPIANPIINIPNMYAFLFSIFMGAIQATMTLPQIKPLIKSWAKSFMLFSTST